MGCGEVEIWWGGAGAIWGDEEGWDELSNHWEGEGYDGGCTATGLLHTS